MWSALGEVIVTSAGIAVSPVAIGVTVVLLMSQRGTAKATSFAVGWCATVATAGRDAARTPGTTNSDACHHQSMGVTNMATIILVVSGFLSVQMFAKALTG